MRQRPEPADDIIGREPGEIAELIDESDAGRSGGTAEE